jgi:hypothetical protein
VARQSKLAIATTSVVCGQNSGKTDAKPKFEYSSIILPLAIPPDGEASGIQLKNLEKRDVFSIDVFAVFQPSE